MPPIISPTRKRNALWPLQRGKKGWETGTIAERYSSAIHHLVRTPKGSIIWAPDFGTELHLLRTQSITDEDEMLVASDLQSALSRFVPDVKLLGVELQGSPDSEKLTINVTWGVADASDIGTRSAQPRFAFGPVKQSITI